MLSQDIWKLFRRYIALNTSLPEGENYPAAIALLSDFTGRCGFTTQTVRIPQSAGGKKNRVNLIARRIVSDTLPTLLIYNHIDTVPAAYPGAFSLTVREGKAFGRGACDHKGSTVAVLDALAKLKTKKLRFNLVFLASTDEETDQLPQLEYITPLLKLPENAVAFDPDTFAGGISIAHIGQLGLRLDVHGKSVHSGMSHLGVNAIEDANKLISFFVGIRHEFEKQHSKFPTFPNAAGAEVSSRCNVTMLESGVAMNVIPDLCRITIDCRFIPEVDTAIEEKKLFKKTMDFLKKNKIDADLKVASHIHGYSSDHPLAHQLNETYKSVSGESGLFAVMGSTPLAHWCKAHRLAHFGLGVARFDTRMHGLDEFAYVKDLEQLSTTLQKFFV